MPTMPARKEWDAATPIGESKSVAYSSQTIIMRYHRDQCEFTLAAIPMSVNTLESAPDRSETSRVEEVYERVLLLIVRGELAAGTALRSTQIAKQLGISRTPVVQALQRLAADGIVTLEMNKRAVVRPGAEKWLVEIHELRELLEPAAAARAAERITEDELSRLGEL